MNYCILFITDESEINSSRFYTRISETEPMYISLTLQFNAVFFFHQTFHFLKVYFSKKMNGSDRSHRFGIKATLK